MPRMPTYKPLLFTTTMRNPERLKDFLKLFYEYNGEILTDELIKKVAIKLIQKGLYQPTDKSDEVKEKWKSGEELTLAEAKQVFRDNPQSHKEAGFARGWSSRFDTWFKLAKELGFVYYWMNSEIEFSASGKMLIDEENPQNEQLVFANAFAKYQRHNPFRRIRNSNVPLILLIEVIRLLNADEEYNGAGISKKEIPLLLSWQDNNAEGLYREIKKLRKAYSYNISDEIILEKTEELRINNGKVTRMNPNSILVDYPDDFIRKMRLTGLITLRGAGRFIDINKKEISAIDYILKNYSNFREFESEKKFFDFIGTIDTKLISNLTVYKTPIRTTNNELMKWVEHYDWNSIKNEMLNLANRRSSRDDILKIIEAPLRLEFLTSLAILNKLPNVDVKPNFVSDDEGLPVSFASGGNPDIECSEDDRKILIEVTLLKGTQQHIRESFSIQRHLEDYTNQGINAFTLFVSPKAFIDTCRNADFIKHQYKLEIRIQDIDLFLEQLETQDTLYKAAYSKTSC
jgi:hypothetical protein